MMSRHSSRKSTHEELMAASQAVEQEYNAVKRLKRLSLGNSLNFDPDLPPEEMDFEDLTYNDLQSHNNSLLNNQNLQNRSNKESEPSPLNNNSEVIGDFELEDENDEFYDVDKMDFLDIDPDSSLTDSNMIWVPATAHPKLAPDNFRKHVQKTVKEINTKLQRANSVKSSLGIESTNVIDEEDEDNDNGKFIDASEGDKENTNFLPNRKKSSASTENDQARKPSLRELTEQLENLSQIAGLGSDDAVTLARSLSTKSIGISKIEKEVYNNSDIQPKKPSGSSKYSFHNKKVRASLYFEDEEDDDYTKGIDDLDEKLVQLDVKDNQKNSSNENLLRRTKWSNYRKTSNKVQDSSNNKLHPIHVYKDIQKIHNNVKRPLGKPQIETIKSKSPSSKLPALPSKQNKKKINSSANGLNKSSLDSSKSLPATPITASTPSMPFVPISTAPAKNNIQNNPYNSYVNNHSASSLNSIGNDLNSKSQQKSQSHSQVQQIINSQPQSQKSPRSSSWGWLSKNKDKDLDKAKEKEKEGEREKGKDIVNDFQVPVNHSRNRHMGTISDVSPLEVSKKLPLDTESLGVKQADARLISRSEESIPLTSNLDKEKEEDKVKEKKPSFTSFFKLKRDKQRTNSDATEDTEPRLGFKKKRSQSHSTEVSSPKTDFKSFFSGKNHKENKDKKEQPGFGPGGLSVKVPTSTNSSPLPSPNPSTTSLSISHDNPVESFQSLNNSQSSINANKQPSQLATEQLKSDNQSSTSPVNHLPQYQPQHQQQSHFQSQHQPLSQIEHQVQHQGHQQGKAYNPKQRQQGQRSTQPLSQSHNRSVQEQQNPFPLSHSAQSNGTQRKISQNQQKSRQQKHQPKLKSKSQTHPHLQLKSRMQPQAEVQSQTQSPTQTQTQTQPQPQPQLQIQTQPQAEPKHELHPQSQPQPQVQSQPQESEKSINTAILPEAPNTPTTVTTNLPAVSDKSTQILKDTLKVCSRPDKPNQPLEMRESAFGFPLPPVSHSTLVMLDYRLPIHVERAIYRLSHLKLADPKRPLYQQVLLSNFMYSYLNLVNHTLYLQQQEQAQENDDNDLIPAVEEEPLNNTNYAGGLVSDTL